MFVKSACLVSRCSNVERDRLIMWLPGRYQLSAPLSPRPAHLRFHTGRSEPPLAKGFAYSVVHGNLGRLSDLQVLVIASLNDAAFDRGYVIGTDPTRLPRGGWREIFNSDASSYGGDNVGNYGATLPVGNGQICAVIPAHGFVVLQKVS